MCRCARLQATKELSWPGKTREREDWDAYGRINQRTRSGDREANNRAVGTSWQMNERTKLLAELSDGNLCSGGRLGADYRLSDRSNAYLT